MSCRPPSPMPPTASILLPESVREFLFFLSVVSNSWTADKRRVCEVCSDNLVAAYIEAAPGLWPELRRLLDDAASQQPQPRGLSASVAGAVRAIFARPAANKHTFFVFKDPSLSDRLSADKALWAKLQADGRDKSGVWWTKVKAGWYEKMKEADRRYCADWTRRAALLDADHADRKGAAATRNIGDIQAPKTWRSACQSRLWLALGGDYTLVDLYSNRDMEPYLERHCGHLLSCFALPALERALAASRKAEGMPGTHASDQPEADQPATKGGPLAPPVVKKGPCTCPGADQDWDAKFDWVALSGAVDLDESAAVLAERLVRQRPVLEAAALQAGTEMFCPELREVLTKVPIEATAAGQQRDLPPIARYCEYWDTQEVFGAIGPLFAEGQKMGGRLVKEMDEEAKKLKK